LVLGAHILANGLHDYFVRLEKKKSSVCVMKSENLASASHFFFFLKLISIFLELEITLVKFLDCTKYHNLHIFLIVFQMLHDFDRIYRIFLGQLGKKHVEDISASLNAQNSSFNANNLTKSKQKKSKKKAQKNPPPTKW